MTGLPSPSKRCLLGMDSFLIATLLTEFLLKNLYNAESYSLY